MSGKDLMPVGANTMPAGIPPFFIVSCARSGSTSLARILDTATNGVCAVEPNPNLTFETREMCEGRIKDPLSVLEATVLPRVRQNLKAYGCYGEKNITYGPFIPYLYEALECRFVFIRRDGRDVVRSLINWHEQMFGNIYRECRDPGNLTPKAVKAAAELPVHLDFSDYARPRPSKDDPLYLDWPHLSRLEMCAYYWATVNDRYLENLEKLPANVWMTIDYTRPNADDIARIFNFCGLSGFDHEKITALLSSKINSNQDRGAAKGTFPPWTEWDSAMRRRFDRFAGAMMTRMGYYGKGEDWMPDGYRNGDQRDLEGASRQVHDDSQGQWLSEWINANSTPANSISSIANFGGSIQVYDRQYFSDRGFIVDTVAENRSSCPGNGALAQSVRLCQKDAVIDLKGKWDLVVCNGALEQAYDIDRYLLQLIGITRRWLCLIAYGDKDGCYAESEHRYAYEAARGTFFNTISFRRVLEMLSARGCKDISMHLSQNRHPKCKPCWIAITARIA